MYARRHSIAPDPQNNRHSAIILETAIEPRNYSKNHEKAGIPISIGFTGMVNGVAIEIPIVS
jgi:hypothetical protein